jgi:uncharacterized low-complexity protein
MTDTSKNIALAISAALTLSMAATAVNATENPFSAKSLPAGYQVADNAPTKMKEGQCSAGKCGASKKATAKKEATDKSTITKVPGEKSKEGSCSAEKMKEGACSAEMKKDMEK